MEYLLVCRSITHAKRTVSRLAAVGILATIVRTPSFAAKEGCGYSVRLDSRWYDKALRELIESGLEPKAVFMRSDGRFIRVM